MATDETRRLAALALGGVALLIGQDRTEQPPDDGGDGNGDTGNGDGGNGDTEPTTHTVAVVAESAGEVNYTIDFEAESVSPAGSGDLAAESNDTITDNGDGTFTVSGFTGNAGFGDTFEYVGEMVGFETGAVTATFRIEIDGEDVTDQWVDDSGGSISGSVGGGADYPNLHTGGDFEVSTLSGLESALSSASSGDVVYVDGTIDTGTRDQLTVPSGVTLAGNRGAGGTSVLDCNDRGVNPLLNVEGRLEGVEVNGPIPDFVGYVDGLNVDYPIGVGVTPGDGSEIANCYLHHFGVIVQNNHAANVHIHHCEVAWSVVEGLGYGIDCDSGGGDSARAVLEYNFLHTCRHEIAAHGGDGYILRYNVFGEPQYSPWDGTLATQRVDDHDCCGFHEVYNNEFRPGNPNTFDFRAGTDSRATCHHNWFFDSNPEGLGDFPSGNVHSNHYGTSSPPEGVGLPR